ncbi:MAG: amino acid ABC transporter substrate-binding protein [Desulfamplus sp.]|nr:amino acid ABC transporter substrate-binding protein [Desulfamplus sp.]MBF0411317.1 amino acid ABC transporter substrate-binding protein [Desulfamplus sp.]
MNIFKKKFVLSYLFFFVITYTICGGTLYSQTNRIQVVYTDWYPYTYMDNEEPLGFEIEIVNAVMKKMNITPEFLKYPWRRCLLNLEEGTADALVSLLKTPEREKYIFFSNSYISLSKTVLFTKTEKNIQFKGNYQALKGYSIGVIAGFTYGDAFDKADYLTKDYAQTPQMLIEKLINDRHDLAAENQVVISGYAAKMGLRDKIRFLEPPIHTQKLYVGFSKAKGLKKLSDEFSKALDKFKLSEEYVVILKKYGVNPSDMIEKIE